MVPFPNINPEIFSDITFYYINQEMQNGLGDAVLHAESIIKNEDFAVLLPDDLFFSKRSCLSQLIDIYDNKKSSVIAVNKIDKENIHKYGVIKPGNISDKFINIQDIVEKPSFEDAPSDIAVCGRYILTSKIFNEMIALTFCLKNSYPF